MYQRNLFHALRRNAELRGRELFHGTNFRHAVEFSRSGRTPSRLFRAVQGQPELRYPVGSAGSNHPSSARLPAWSPHTTTGSDRAAARRAWGMFDRLPRCPAGLPAGPSWLRASNKENISQPPERESNSLGEGSESPNLLDLVAREGVAAERSWAPPGGVDLCELAHRARGNRR